MQQFSPSNNTDNNISTSSNYKPNKLKPAMMTLSGHSCVKSPASLKPLAPLPIHTNKKLHQFKTQKDAEYFATDDFAEFEQDNNNINNNNNNDNNTLINHTPPSQQTQQISYHQHQHHHQQQQHQHQHQHQQHQHQHQQHQHQH
eukprot:442734_1